MAQQEEARGHALAPRNGVGLAGRGTHEAVQLLCDTQVLSGVRVGRLPQHGEHDCLEDLLLGRGRLCLLDQRVGLLDLVVLELVDDEVVLGLGEGLHERGQHLQGVFAVAEHHEVVA